MIEKFNEFIESKTELKKQELIESQNIGVSAKKEFIEIFKNSRSIWIVKGKSHFLVRLPKPTKDQMIVRQLEDKINSEYKAKVFKLEIDKLKPKMKKLED